MNLTIVPGTRDAHTAVRLGCGRHAPEDFLLHRLQVFKSLLLQSLLVFVREIW